MYKRECPSCEKELEYSKKGSRDRAEREGYKCRPCSATGRKLSAETRAKIGAAHKGKKLLPLSAEHRAKLSISHRTCEDGSIRPRTDDALRKQWARDVKKEQGNVCAYRSVDLVPCSPYPLHSHHVFGVKDHPSLRYSLNNGIVLCAEHHAHIHEMAGEHKEANLIRSTIR